jgi:polar amino acid transport system substrate-binding protein
MLHREEEMARCRTGVVMVVMALSAACGGHDDPMAAVQGELVPDGRLRAGVTVGNPVLAMRDPAGGDPSGVAVDVAREIGRRLNVEVIFATYDSAAAMADAAATGAWDVAFLAADPDRAGIITFTPPYLELEATYLVPSGSRNRQHDAIATPTCVPLSWRCSSSARCRLRASGRRRP